jgi:poly(ADP-ribose) glycohydrolase ARH3
MPGADSASWRDAFVGSLLGTAIGDALGRPVKGWSASRIAREHGHVRDMLGHPRGRYTGNTEMMIVLSEWLLEEPDFDGESLARRLRDRYDPDRDYGRTTTDVMRRLRAGESWETAGEHAFARGSFGNGAAARIAPCALRFHREPDELARVVEVSASVTHSHPLGVAGALLQARQIVLVLESTGEALDPSSFIVDLRSATNSIEFRHKLRTVEECLDRRAPRHVVRDRLGANATALGSVPTALFCFLSQPESFEEAVGSAIDLGGETDSIGAMAGAIAGARHGAAAIPARWKSALERGPKGPAYIEEIAARLYERTLARGV